MAKMNSKPEKNRPKAFKTTSKCLHSQEENEGNDAWYTQ
eukprot:CAMPEP_0114600728 /NCGR_PEP_ID=MMETSP0125-20121206/23334_1 /TAXON_ID=485358 ORGANISM="Aristerostoma sp., Strain ATCC 50986" /NCGR_SAMPLE_ID=MMETSP0125 /ASSEMBLY_ACC=CAM_ASM_000245 /LENGTH=38 /DNA_ID= /DNA_START= /DNA_END= /DNA_ORIENTATION=